MKQPLVNVAVVYGAGIILGRFLEVPVAGCLAVALATTTVALAVNQVRGALIVLSIFLLGWSNMSSRSAILSPWDLRVLWARDGAIAAVRGRITDTPLERISVRKGVESSQTLTEIDVTAVQSGTDDWKPASGRVMSRTAGVLSSNLRNGQEVEVQGVAIAPAQATADGMFDYRRHLNSRGVYFEFKVDSPRDWKPIGATTQPSAGERFRTWAQRMLAYGLPEEDEAVRLQWAMLLGWKTALTSEVSEPFMRSGTMHIFAISGLHIALIAGACVALFRAAALPRIACGLLAIPILWFYTAATGWQASAIRATVMMSVIIFGWALRRPSDLVNSLATAACIILLWQPEQLFQAGFQLSFLVVLGIATLGPVIDRFGRRFLQADAMLPDELRPGWQRFGIRMAGKAWSSFAVSAAAFIGSAPLIAHYFHLFTPGSLIANLLIVPVSSLALMSGVGSLLTGWFAPFLAEWFNHSGWLWMRLMVWMSHVAAQTPGAWWHISAPTLLTFCGYYGALVFILSGGLRSTITRRVGIAGAVALSAFYFLEWKERRSWHLVTVLPTRNAHVVYTEPARGEPPWLMNCGDTGSVEFSVKPFLQTRGVNTVPHLVLTHGESRFVGGVQSLTELFPVKKTHVSSGVYRSPRYREALSHLEKHSSIDRSFTNGCVASPWTILYPGAEDRVLGRDGGVVSLGVLDGIRILILPPLEISAQNKIHQQNPNLRADIVIASDSDHNQLALEWVSALQPKLLILALGRSRSGPQEAYIRRLGTVCSVICVGERTGAVTVAARKGSWQIRTPEERFSGFGPELGMDALDVRDE